jgi:hypothetical protein
MGDPRKSQKQEDLQLAANSSSANLKTGGNEGRPPRWMPLVFRWVEPLFVGAEAVLTRSPGGKTIKLAGCSMGRAWTTHGLSRAARKGLGMETQETIEVSGIKTLVKAEGADLSGSSFTDVNLSGAMLRNVNFSEAEIEDANLSGWTVRNACLAGLRISNADLRDAAIEDSLTTGMTIDGIAVSDLTAAYRALTAKAD